MRKGKTKFLILRMVDPHTIIEFIHEVKKYIPDIKYQIQERDQFRPKRGNTIKFKGSRSYRI